MGEGFPSPHGEDVPEDPDVGAAASGLDVEAPEGGPPRTGRPGRRRKKVVALVLAAALLAGGIGAGVSLAGRSSTPNGTASSATATVRIPSVEDALAAKVRSTSAIATATSPAVVKVEVTEASPTSLGPTSASGTGIVLTSSGTVLTNRHVVANSTSVNVTIPGERTYPAKVLGVDRSADVALLQIEGFQGRLPTVRLGNAETVAVGDAVVAIGYAYGRPSASVVTGTVAGLDQTATAADRGVVSSTETLHGLVEVNAPIVSGDSGGPLLDTRGQVVGVNTIGSTPSPGTSPYGFAIPINDAVAAANKIAERESGDGVTLGLRAFLGIFEQAGATSTGGVEGVRVSDVAIGGPAEEAGIVGGDTITAIDGRATPTSARLHEIVTSHRPGDEVRVSYVDAAGTPRTVSVRLGAIAA